MGSFLVCTYKEFERFGRQSIIFFLAFGRSLRRGTKYFILLIYIHVSGSGCFSLFLFQALGGGNWFASSNGGMKIFIGL